MSTSKIEWTDHTWNPVTGCTKVSEGCRHCYAKTLHDRRHKGHQNGAALPPQYAHPFEKIQLHESRLTDPLHWKQPSRIFVNSMSDLFHEDVSPNFIVQVFGVMQSAWWHDFQILTKRPERMIEFFDLPRVRDSIRILSEATSRENNEEIRKQIWPLPNIWLGVSVEDQKTADARIPLLLKTPAAVRFISYEPALGPLSLESLLSLPSLKCSIDWVIAGGESNLGDKEEARPANHEWFRSIRNQCAAANVPFLFKQWGEWVPRGGMTWDEWIAPDGRRHSGSFDTRQHLESVLGFDYCGIECVGKKAAGRLLDGVIHDTYPRPHPSVSSLSTVHSQLSTPQGAAQC